jgi:sulfur relay (sulfurtransferase) DsrC/TusE family protein
VTAPRVIRTAAEVVGDALTDAYNNNSENWPEDIIAALAEEGYAFYRPDEHEVVEVVRGAEASGFYDAGSYCLLPADPGEGQ